MKRREIIPLIVLGVACALVCLVPAPRPLAADDTEAVRARVTAVDDSDLTHLGLLEYGSQHIRVQIDSGTHAGETFAANNELRAQLELDKKFVPGDRILVTMPQEVTPTTTLVARDHWRLGWGAVLFGIFCALLICFGGWTGAKALFSFVFSCLVIWKGVIPLALSGWPASWTCFAAVCLLTAVIMYLVAGATRKGVTAFLGATLGVFSGLATAHLFGYLMHVTGTTLPYVQALLYSGYETLDMADIFVGAVVLASSGAVMDLAMDIAAGQAEVVRHNPTLPRMAVLASGLRMGRSVVGTMTTTLLLAYSGGYITLLMMFAAQGTPIVVFLNSTLVSAEVVKTLTGSFALVLVAPFTALVGSWVLQNARK